MDSVKVDANYKDLIFSKLSRSILSCIGTQLLILLVYVLWSHFRILHPLEWITSTLTIFTSFTTWFLIFLFVTIIFVQSIISGKDYVHRPVKTLTRFQKLVSVFSVHHCLILVLNILSADTLIWLLLELNGSSQKGIFTVCGKTNTEYCLNEYNFLLIFGGFLNGVYYFVKFSISEKHLEFPVIYQRKFLQIKYYLLPLVKECLVLALSPLIYFIIFNALWGEILINKFIEFFEIKRLEYNVGYSNFSTYFDVWVFGTMFYYHMNLVNIFVNVFLTEPIIFPLHKTSEKSLHLQKSISMTAVPIIQNLASFDLLNLANWSAQRRQIFFSLSQPGGHPHYWNALVENILKLFSDYIDILNKSTEGTVSSIDITAQLKETALRNSQMSSLSMNKFHNLRNMSLISDKNETGLVELTQEPFPIFNMAQEMLKKCSHKLTYFLSFLKTIFGINFLFGQLPQANMHSFFGNGYIIIWISQGISELVCASLNEDTYGIVQKDLPAIITTLVNFNLALEKLNKVPNLARNVTNHKKFKSNMKNAVLAAVRRSLFNIYLNFENHLNELPLTKDVTNHLINIVRNV